MIEPDETSHLAAWQTQQKQVKAALNNHIPALSAADIDVIAQSDFLQQQLILHPDWLGALHSFSANPPSLARYFSDLHQQLSAVTDEPALMQVLREFRYFHLICLEWAQLTHAIPTAQILPHLSALAEALIVSAKNWLYAVACQEWGTPCSTSGEIQPLLVMGMGKLGGGELNFSSDVDLIFVYPEEGETQGVARSLDNSTFFTRLAQRLIKVLDKPTAAGFVYRVDMRLRPFGDSGPLVMSFGALEDYYQEQGRDWERYAMIKGRILGEADTLYAQNLVKMLRPFVYRRYIDFSVIQSLRNMKNMIEREVIRRGLRDNIKLGAGGIREIEFIAQVFQLIRGGQEKRLQQSGLLAVLNVISDLHLLPAETVDTLRDNYLFLRRLENLLQGINDTQGQTLPHSLLDQARLARGMGATNWTQLYDTISGRLQQTRHIFADVSGQDDAREKHKAQQVDPRYVDLWSEALMLSEWQELLPDLAESDVALIFAEIGQFKLETEKRTMGMRGREVLDALMPRVLAWVLVQPKVMTILPRLLPILRNIMTRTTYLELLLEYPIVVQHLSQLCEQSVMIASLLAQHPILLDELIDRHSLFETLEKQQYQSNLFHYLLSIPDGDEQQMEVLRQFKQAQLLHIAAADISGHLPTMKVSDHLTYLAEAIIAAVVKIAWQQMTQRYGRPSFLLNETETGFLVVGYGKLGGWELGYGSDLDLIFLTSCPENDATNGAKSIDSMLFYQRLAQRILHLFSARTNGGILYEVDMRLRPAGDSGLLVATLAGFENYQQNEAWTWEHQALVRARSIEGDEALKAQFQAIRHRILCQPRQIAILQSEVREMREKMRQHLSANQVDQFDLKIDEGGIGDIEFIAQYLVLAYAQNQPALTQWSDNVRIFELMAKYGLMPAHQAQMFNEIYVMLRDKSHKLSLQAAPTKVGANEFLDARQFVKQCWQQWLLKNDHQVE